MISSSGRACGSVGAGRRIGPVVAVARSAAIGLCRVAGSRRRIARARSACRGPKSS